MFEIRIGDDYWFWCEYPTEAAAAEDARHLARRLQQEAAGIDVRRIDPDSRRRERPSSLA
jgi:hypothetical protein